ncbi:hypothetical protein BC833DRAFT_606220 [Globomyces pollinis-pini]|nr:hypothetical protein BC833DRAFT_606220 [Globomyces pollinis-pini]
MIKILFFAKAKDYTKCDTLLIEHTINMDLNDIRNEIQERFQELKQSKVLETCGWAINLEYVDDFRRIINDQDEIAIIPPVSGG